MVGVDVGSNEGSGVEEGLAFKIIEAFVEDTIEEVHAARVGGIAGKEGR